jgi:tight adherence protein C
MIVAIVAVMLFIGSIIYLVSTSIANHRSDARRRLLDLDRGSMRDEDSIIAKLLDPRDRNKFERKLQAAGWYGLSVVQYYRRVLISAGSGAAFGLVVVFIIHVSLPIIWLLAVLFPAVLGLIIPSTILDKAIAARRKEIEHSLPEFLDLVSTMVEAGVALNGAMSYAVEGIRGALHAELTMVLADIRIGRMRAEALASMASRCNVQQLTTTITSIIQAERLGGNIAELLDMLAAEAREIRLSRAEELAAQLPVKMTIPMSLFMLPALFVIIFGALWAKLSGP